VETLFNLILWGLAGSVGLALLGAVFGAVVRAVAVLNGTAHERTLAQAIGNGFISGGLFLAVIGFGAGSLIGYHEPPLGNGLVMLAVFAAIVFTLMILAALFAAFACLCIWLGVRATGIFLAVAIALGFCGIAASNAGIDTPWIAGAQTIVGASVLALLIVLRARSPAKQQLFEPWAEPPPAASENRIIDVRIRSND
jgi:hypothetical protein